MITGLEAVVAAGKMASAGGALARSSPVVIRHAKRLWFRARRGSVTIPVFGAGGVGKSTVSGVIAGGSFETSDTLYRESLWLEDVPLRGDIPGRLLVAPGQAARIDRHWPSLFKEMATETAVGLINVVSYGYHSLNILRVADSDVWISGMKDADFLDAYCQQRRKIELDLLNHLVNGLSPVTSNIWMATIINKQDLWGDRASEVMSYYSSGDYAAQLDQVADRLGRSRFQHEYVPTCLTLANLTTGNGEVVASTVAGYDHAARARSLQDLSAKLGLLVSK